MGWLKQGLRAAHVLTKHGWRETCDCVLCGASADDAGRGVLCKGCDGTLPTHPQVACPQCGIATQDAMVCGECLADSPAFDATVTVFAYRYPLDHLLHSFKYASNLALTEFFSARMIERVRGRGRVFPDVLMPMPLARMRLSERGFNQALLIAENVAEDLSLPLERYVLQRVRETRPQTGLTWSDRRANVKGAFACSKDLTGKHVAIVDDVMTTGATLNEAAKVLKSRGAGKVTAWVIARATKEISALGWETGWEDGSDPPRV